MEVICFLPLQSFGAASFFGFVATAVYGYDAFIKFQVNIRSFLTWDLYVLN